MEVIFLNLFIHNKDGTHLMTMLTTESNIYSTLFKYCYGKATLVNYNIASFNILGCWDNFHWNQCSTTLGRVYICGIKHVKDNLLFHRHKCSSSREMGQVFSSFIYDIAEV